MSDDRLKEALAPAAACPGVEELGQYADGTMDVSAKPALESHIAKCGHCRSELALLRQFAEGAVRPEEQRDVAWIRSRLEHRAHEIFEGGEQTASSVPWWKALWSAPTLSRAALVLGCLLVVVSATVYFNRNNAPGLDTSAGSGAGVLRSNTVALVSPKGDLSEPPAALVWNSVPNAAQYRVRIVEVDQTELWKTDVANTSVPLPAAVREQVRPAKTLLWQVTALDSAGNQIGASDLESFRLTPQPR